MRDHKDMHAVLQSLCHVSWLLTLQKNVLPCAGADKVDNTLAWLTVLTRLADPAPFSTFKRLCVEVASADMDWKSSQVCCVCLDSQRKRHRCDCTYFARGVQVGATALGGSLGSVPRTPHEAEGTDRISCQQFPQEVK